MQLFLEDSYIINPDFMQMVGYYDRNGKLCTLVTELTRTFIVNRSPLQILDDSIRYIGFDLRGAMETARRLLSNKHMCPVMVNPIFKICVFPNKSARNDDTMWFNPNHIKRTISLNMKTQVEFTNGLTLLVPSKLYSFNHKLQTAEQFRNLIVGAGNKSTSYRQDA